jgi:hypothetical protein
VSAVRSTSGVQELLGGIATNGAATSASSAGRLFDPQLSRHRPITTSISWSNNKAHLDHLLRRADATSRGRYQELKRANAKRSMGDLNVYTARKAELGTELLTRARSERGLPPADYWRPTREELGAADN